MGAIHGRGYYDRIGLGEACFSGARGRCRGSDGSAQAASACPGSGVLQSTAALSGWPEGVRDGALLGAGLARAWPRGATAQYVKAYIKRNKHDAADAEAICEAVQRPTMRFVPVKTADQQAAVLLHRGRERLVRQHTGLVNALRGHLAEFGVIAPQGLRNVGKLIAIVRDEGDARLPDLARQVLQVLAVQIEQLEAAVAAIEKQLMAWHKSNPVSQRLASVPGIGPIIATAIAATVVEPSGFRSGREFAAWLGLVPRQNSTGGKHRLGGISKRGNPYLRRLLINGASANLLRSKATNADPWVIGLRQRRPPLVVAVALANKTARIAWGCSMDRVSFARSWTSADSPIAMASSARQDGSRLNIAFA